MPKLISTPRPLPVRLLRRFEAASRLMEKPGGVQYTVQEAAAVLAMGDDQVRALVDTGELSAVAIGDDVNAKRIHWRIGGWSILGWLVSGLRRQGFTIPAPIDPTAEQWAAHLQSQPFHTKIKP